MPTKKVKIKSYVATSPRGKKYRVKSHTKRLRTLGKKVTFKKAGTFLVGHDEKGNFRGSKIVPLSKPLKLKKPTKKKPTKKTKVKPRKARRARTQLPLDQQLNKVDTDFFNKKITETAWLKKRKQIMGLN